MIASDEDAGKAVADFKTFQAIETESIDLVHGQVTGEDEENFDEEEIEEYVVNPERRHESAKVTSLTAISLLHRFVQVRY